MILKVPIFVNYTLENDIRARAWAERGDQIRNYQLLNSEDEKFQATEKGKSRNPKELHIIQCTWL